MTSINKSSSTHLYFYDLWGLSTDIIILMYKLYILSPFTTQKMSPQGQGFQIAIFVETFCPHNVEFTRTHTHQCH